jgi:polar amino acid transport system substrate-binding protein
MSVFSKLAIPVAIILSVLAVTSQAQDEMIIAVGEWPPYISEDQKHNGVVSHIITEVFSDMGIEVTIQFLPWSRAYNETMEGLHPASAVWMYNEQREADFIYSDAVLVEEFVFFHAKKLLFDWQSVADLKGFSIGGVNASSYGPTLDKAIIDGEVLIDRVIRPQQNFKKLLYNRIDIFPFEVNVGHAVLNKHFTEDEQARLTYHPKPFLNNSSYVLFPKKLSGSKALSQQFNRSLEKIKSSGRYDAYFKMFKQGYYNKD